MPVSVSVSGADKQLRPCRDTRLQRLRILIYTMLVPVGIIIILLLVLVLVSPVWERRVKRGYRRLLVGGIINDDLDFSELFDVVVMRI